MQVLGAAWYLLSVDRYTSCWKSECKNETAPIKCLPKYLDCDTFKQGSRITWENSTSVFKNCDPTNDITFKYGIFENAVAKNVVSSDFVKKYFYCLWWGLQQLRYAFIVTMHHNHPYLQYDFHCYSWFFYIVRCYFNVAVTIWSQL